MPSDAISPADPIQTPHEKKEPQIDVKEIQKKASELSEEVKKTLEYQLAGKEATVIIREKTLTFKKWGLKKRLTLGAKVNTIFSRVRSIFPTHEVLDIFSDMDIMTALIANLSEDIMLIVSQSLVSPFRNANEAMEWIDEECDHSDLFDMAVIIWEMNLKGDSLGKFLTGMEGMTTKVNKLFKM